MTDIEESFDAHPRFEPADAGDGWTPTTNDWNATVSVDGDAVAVAVELPTLDAVVTEPVAPVVEDGWYETLALRLEDVDGVTYATVSDLRVDRDTTTVAVAATLDARPGKAADDALAVVNYVEGTWFEGVIPGFDYVDDVQAMRERAHQHGQGGNGTPL